MDNKNDSFLEDQSNYIEKVKKIVENGNKKYAMIRTYGCQQNFSDSEKIKGILSVLGFDFTEDPKKADFIIFNTCAIREHAEDRVFGNVGALKNIKKKNKNLIIALCGCMMEQDHIKEKIKKSFPFVDLVFGTHSINYLPKLIFDVISNDKRVFEINKEDDVLFEDIPVKREDKIKGFVPIMYGCDNFCSYCIVPYVRGRERSRNSEDILSEVKKMIHSGYKEITLLGQNVNSYGKNLNEDINFSELLKKIDNLEGDFWIRFMTSHPKDATEELIDTIANSKHICHQIHLPFQSGNNKILKQMNRHYDREKYLSIINYAKDKISDLTLTSDVIVGFPGETYKEFCDTLSLIKEVKFSSLFTFIYSKREGTPAAKMDDSTSADEKSKRFSELLKLQTEISDNLYKKMIGREYKVLVESLANKDGKLTARTNNGIVVELDGDKRLLGKFLNVKIIDAKRCLLIGEIL